MTEAKQEQATTPLSVREKMAIYLVIMLLKLVKPFNWTHEIDKALEEVKACMEKGAQFRFGFPHSSVGRAQL